MSNTGRKSRQTQKQDNALVWSFVLKNQGAPYNPAENPFEQGTLRHDRFERWYKRDVLRYHEGESRLNDLMHVYHGCETEEDRVAVLYNGRGVCLS